MLSTIDNISRPHLEARLDDGDGGGGALDGVGVLVPAQDPRNQVPQHPKVGQAQLVEEGHVGRWGEVLSYDNDAQLTEVLHGVALRPGPKLGGAPVLLKPRERAGQDPGR